MRREGCREGADLAAMSALERADLYRCKLPERCLCIGVCRLLRMPEARAGAGQSRKCADRPRQDRSARSPQRPDYSPSVNSRRWAALGYVVASAIVRWLRFIAACIGIPGNPGALFQIGENAARSAPLRHDLRRSSRRLSLKPIVWPQCSEKALVRQDQAGAKQ